MLSCIGRWRRTSPNRVWMLAIALRPTLTLGATVPGSANTRRGDVESQEVVTVSHVGNPGLLGRKL